MNLTNKVVVVTDADWDATLPEWNIVDYSASKAAMANFAKSRSKEFGPKGIRVNSRGQRRYPIISDLWRFTRASRGTLSRTVSSSWRTEQTDLGHAERRRVPSSP